MKDVAVGQMLITTGKFILLNGWISKNFAVLMYDVIIVELKN